MSLVFNVKHLVGSLTGQNQRLALNEGQVIRLGRNPEMDIKYSESADDAVSSVHAELSLQGGRLYIEDKRSSNGTFVNGALCPAFEKIAVPDGSRVRLAKEGPEMQITFDNAPALQQPAPAAAAPPPPPTDSSLPPKHAVGRDTLLREIDRAKEEERDIMASEVAKTRRSTGVWLAAGAFLLIVLIVVAAGGVYWLNRQEASQQQQAMQNEFNAMEQEVGKNVWIEVEQRVSPAVAHIRCRFHLDIPQLFTQDSIVNIQTDSIEVTGSAVLIRPGLLLTAKHVVEPWKYSINWGETPFGNWDEFAEATQVKPVYESLQIQFPGLQPILGTTTATAETSDLALISIPEVTIDPITVITKNQAVRKADELAIIGYPLDLGQQHFVSFDHSGTGTATVTRLTEMQPIFLKGTVTLPVPDVGDSSHHFSMDASIEPGNSGGPVLNRDGNVVGIISQKLQVHGFTEFNGVQYPTMREIPASAQAVSPGDIQVFLTRSGIL